MEVLSGLSGNDWTGNGMYFATEDEAKRAGYELLSRWFVPIDSRAVQRNKPVNAEFPEGIDRPRLIEL